MKDHKNIDKKISHVNSYFKKYSNKKIDFTDSSIFKNYTFKTYIKLNPTNIRLLLQ